MSNKSPKKAIKSNYIFRDSCSPPLSGYLLIDGSKFSTIVPLSSLSPSQEKDLLSSYEFLDYAESYIMPGIIDLNVHTNSSFENEWVDVESLTKQAIQGGVTTILDNPILSKYNENFDESASLALRKAALSQHIFTDCGLLAYLGPHNYKQMEKIYEDPCIIGFKAYLAHTLQNNLPFFKKETLEKLHNFLKKTQLQRLFLSFHPEKATLRDLFLSSPLRNLEIGKRLDLSEDITNSQKFGGGIHGEMSSSDDSNKSDKSSDSDSENTLKNNLKEIMPTSASLRKRAQENDKLREEQNIHKQEISEYYFNEEEKEIIKNLQTSDSEIEYVNETTSSSSSSDEESKEEIKDNCEKALVNRGFKTKLATLANIKISNTLDYNKKDPAAAVFSKNPLISNIRATLGTLKAVSAEPENKSPGKERKVSGLLQRRKIANSAVVGKKETEALKNFQISIGKEKDAPQSKKLGNNNYENFLYNHSLSWETNGVKTLIKTFRSFSQGNLLLANLSSPSLAFLVREGHKNMKNIEKTGENIPIFCETATPYLYFYNGMIKKGQCKFKNSPPIRDKETRNLLIEGLKIENLFHVISSFHMSVPRPLKTVDGGDFKRCFNGLSSVGANLSVVWSKLYAKEKLALKKYGEKLLYEENLNKIFKVLVKLLCEKPAEIAFLRNKGCIKQGFDADFVVWSPFEIKEFKDKDIFLKEKKGYLFRKQKLYGKVTHTFLRGQLVFSEKNKFFLKKGELLRRNE